MPKYTLPAAKAEKDKDTGPISVRGDYQYPDEWARNITIPVNPAILAALEVGGDAEVTLRGKITELTSNQSESGSGRTNITISISEVEAYMEDEAEEAAEEAFESGFGKKRGMMGRNSGLY